MTPLERYQADLQRPDFFHDAAQANAVKHLQRLYDDLVAADHAKPGLFGKLLGRKSGGPVKGLYFWGGVGRGKTYLVDTFFESLPFEQKVRTHFHRFMKRVHEELKTLKGEKNPLTIIGKRFADEARVICFDEFFVSDITDAMILATLLEEPVQEWREPGGDLQHRSGRPVQGRPAARASCRRSPCSRSIPRSSTSTAASTIDCVRWSRRSCSTGRSASRSRRRWRAASRP